MSLKWCMRNQSCWATLLTLSQDSSNSNYKYEKRGVNAHVNITFYNEQTHNYVFQILLLCMLKNLKLKTLSIDAWKNFYIILLSEDGEIILKELGKYAHDSVICKRALDLWKIVYRCHPFGMIKHKKTRAHRGGKVNLHRYMGLFSLVVEL